MRLGLIEMDPAEFAPQFMHHEGQHGEVVVVEFLVSVLNGRRLEIHKRRIRFHSKEFLERELNISDENTSREIDSVLLINYTSLSIECKLPLSMELRCNRTQQN